MNICLINTYDSTGGAAIACRRLMHALNKESQDVNARMLVEFGRSNTAEITRLDRSPVKKTIGKIRLVMERISFKPLHNGEINAFYFSPANTGTDITSHPDVLNADIIHLHWVNLGFLSIKDIKKLAGLGKPIVWTLHDMWAFTGGCHYSGECEHFTHKCGECMFLKKPHKNDISRKLNLQKIFFKDFHFVTCSHWLKEEALRSSLLSDASVTSIPNPIDIDLFKPNDKKKARISLGLDPDTDYILFGAANIDDGRKGFEYLMESLNILAPRIKDKKVEILLFGRSDVDQEALPLKLNALGSLDSMEKIAAVYNAASVFVIPSLQDNLPNTIMESLACGTPVAAFKSGGIPEMVQHKVSGYIADWKDSKGLAEGIEYILENDGFKDAAREKVISSYHPAVVARQYSLLYQSLLQSQ